LSALRAGVAKSEISTEDPTVMIVHDPLFAKALVLDDGATRVAILAMDAVAIGGICDISDEFLPQLRGRIESELSIPGANVLVNASHTHTPGPMLVEHAEQVERTFDAVRRALEAMVEVTSARRGHEDRWIINRTLRTHRRRRLDDPPGEPLPARRRDRGPRPDRPGDRHHPRGPRRRQPARGRLQLRLPPAGGCARRLRDRELPRLRLRGHRGAASAAGRWRSSSRAPAAI
jgi:hypothetical protein